MHLRVADPELDRTIREVCRLCRDAGGRAWVVGGAVRDTLLGASVQDADLEVHGLAAARLETLLAERFAVDPVGKAFGVLKLRGVPLDVALPRTESKAGLGHRGFLVQSDPHMGLERAMRRRDFTLNALALDPLDGTLADPLGGRADLTARRLRHCSEAFGEDPLRVLRGMQLTARFALTPDPATVAICRRVGPEGLARERIWQEWRKLLLRGREPSRGLRFLRDTGWVDHFPPLAAVVGLPQSPDSHPEGDVYTHTGLCLDAFAAGRVGDDHEDLVVGLAVLTHDLGKPKVHVRGPDGDVHAPDHARVGVPVAAAFLEHLTGQPALVREVLPLVRDHGRPKALWKQQAGDPAIRRLASGCGRLDRLLRVVRADHGGRGRASDPDPPFARWLEERARALGVLAGPLPALVHGRDVLAQGVARGRRVGQALEACYEAQLAGEVADRDGALAYLERWLREHPGEPPGPAAGGG